MRMDENGSAHVARRRRFGLALRDRALDGRGNVTYRRPRGPGRQVRRRSVAQRVSWWRVDSCSLRRTEETWLSTVLTEM